MKNVWLMLTIVIFSGPALQARAASKPVCNEDESDYNKCTVEDERIVACSFGGGLVRQCDSRLESRSYCTQQSNGKITMKIRGENRPCKEAWIRGLASEQETDKTPHCKVTIRSCPFLTAKQPKATKRKLVFLENGFSAIEEIDDEDADAYVKAGEFGRAKEKSRLEGDSAYLQRFTAVTGLPKIGAHFKDSGRCRKIKLDAEGNDVRGDDGRLVFTDSGLDLKTCCELDESDPEAQPTSDGYRVESRQEYWERFCSLKKSVIKLDRSGLVKEVNDQIPIVEPKLKKKRGMIPIETSCENCEATEEDGS